MHDGEPAGASVPPGDDPAEAERAGRLLARLAAEADRSGFLRFDRFMEITLYAPEVGYYDRPRSPLGTSGDFYTAPQVHPLFGRTVADRMHAVRRALGAEERFRLMEVGPGDGTLAATLVETLGEARPPALPAELVLVERSPERGAAAVDRVRTSAGRLGVPVRLVGSVGEIGPFEGIVLANELFDAQPTRRLRWTGTDWCELGVRVRDGRIEAAESTEVALVPSPALPVPEEAGTVVEIAPLAQSLVREVADHLVRGELVVLDYGMEEGELLRGHPEGTLAAVRGHRTGLDPLSSPGTVDLSTFVNFTRLRDASARAGLEVVSNRSQAEALDAWGLRYRVDEAVQRAAGPAEELGVRLAAKNLLFGFERFRVLEFAPPASASILRAPPT